MQLAAETLPDLGASVALNVPFRGAEPVSACSDPVLGRHSLQIEINRRLYTDEDSRERTAGLETLRGDLEVLGRVLREYAVGGA